MVYNKRCQVTRVVDLSEERRNYVKNLYPSIDVVDDASIVFEDPDIDGIIIATPVFTHYDLAIKALKGGKRILVEKPLARSVVEVEEIGKIAAK